MHLHIHIPKDHKEEFESHKKLVGDIRGAVAEHKKTQHIIDSFLVCMLLIFLMYVLLM